jgi:hypothetical protein
MRCLVKIETFIFRSVKARDRWKRDRINRSYHSEFITRWLNHWRRHRGDKRKGKSRENTHTMALHNTEEFYHDLRRRANENLALSTPLSIDNVFLQRTVLRARGIALRVKRLARQSFYM